MYPSGFGAAESRWYISRCYGQKGRCSDEYYWTYVFRHGSVFDVQVICGHETGLSHSLSSGNKRGMRRAIWWTQWNSSKTRVIASQIQMVAFDR